MSTLLPLAVCFASFSIQKKTDDLFTLTKVEHKSDLAHKWILVKYNYLCT